MTRTLTLVALLFLSTTAFAQTGALTFNLGPIEMIGTSYIAHSFGTLANHSNLDIPNVTVQIGLHGPRTTYIGGQNDASWTCRNEETPDRLLCVNSLIRAGETSQLQIYVGPIHESRVQLFGQASWQYFEATLRTETTRQTRSFGREVAVTNTGDAGPGSLRAAIEYANDTCTNEFIPCRIVFNIPPPVPGRGWYTILPNTPLPAITTTDIEIDGATQTQFSGDTNPLGPEIMLDGSAVGVGHGLRLAGEGLAVVRNLAIGGFPWDGIAVSRDSFARSLIADNYIGTDATGTHALPNGSRGITFDLPASEFDVTHNLISGNARSGVFIAGAYSITLEENTIRGNGAAGVLIGPQATTTLLRRNVIANNAKFGVAIAPEVNRYSLVDNSIIGNGFIGIDRGVDGFSGYESDEQIVTAAKIPPPRLLSATYEPRNHETTIVGAYGDENDAWGTWTITLFRNTTDDGQGEFVVGHTVAKNGTFRFVVPADLTGQFITATGQRAIFLGLSGDWSWTSEFSEPVQVR
jgi:parallel beta-helix repeat protein